MNPPSPFHLNAPLEFSHPIGYRSMRFIQQIHGRFPQMYGLVRKSLPIKKLLLLLYFLSSVLLLSACNTTSSDSRFIRNEIRRNEELVGFLGDSSVAVYQTVYSVDWFESEDGNDEYSRAKPLYFRVRLYNFVDDSYSESVDLPPYSYAQIFGGDLYYLDKSKEQYKYDFITRTHTKMNLNYNNGIFSIGADGNAVFTCIDGVARLNVNGRITELYKNGANTGYSCEGYQLVSKNQTWYLYNDFNRNIKYIKVSNSGISPVIETQDQMSGSMFIQNIGRIPYQLIGDELVVPNFIDPDEKLRLAMRQVKSANSLDAKALNEKMDKYIKDNTMYSLMDGSVIYSAANSHGYLD